jgi:hypothetical protein
MWIVSIFPGWWDIYWWHGSGLHASFSSSSSPLMQF